MPSAPLSAPAPGAEPGDDPAALLAAAREAMLRRDYATAGRLLGDAARVAPQDPEVHRSWANFYFERGRFAAAQRSAQRAVELRPDGIRDLLLLGQVAYRQKDLALACQCFRRVVALRPSHRGAQSYVARLGCP